MMRWRTSCPVLVDEFWRRTHVQPDWQARLAEKILSLNAQPDADMIQPAADDVPISSLRHAYNSGLIVVLRTELKLDKIDSVCV